MGTEELFRSIYERYLPILRIRALQFGIPYDEVEDVIQETFLSFYCHYLKTAKTEEIRPLLCEILKNRCIDFVRRKSCRPLTYLDFDILRVEGEIRGQLVNKDVLSTLLRQEEYREIWDALNSMREDWAQVFILHIIQGRPISEVSKIMGTTDAACRTRISRGRNYLKKKLKRGD